ncbi:MAG: hypothetical protein IEMM0008_1166 [bacterium]|nr:MAG: hypothetical protein IEMM0008_1166 [bacterium]
MDHYDDMIHFIDSLRELPKKASLPLEVEIELKERCDDVENIVRSSRHLIGSEKQNEVIFALVDYAKTIPDQASLDPHIEKDLRDQCLVVETLAGRHC